MSKVSEAVPLCAALRVELVQVVVGKPLPLCEDGVLEPIAIKSGYLRYVQREIQRDELASSDFLCGSEHTLRREQIQSSKLIVLAPDPCTSSAISPSLL